MACMHVCSLLVLNQSVCVCARQGPIGYETLSEFPYAAAVVNEALRLYPPGPVLSRISLKDTKASLYFCRDPHKIAEYVPYRDLATLLLQHIIVIFLYGKFVTTQLAWPACALAAAFKS